MKVSQLAKNVELLNQATMTMSGHDLPQTLLDGDGNFLNLQEESASERRSSVRFHGDHTEGHLSGAIRPATAPTYDFHQPNVGNGPAVSKPVVPINRPASAPNGKGAIDFEDKPPEDVNHALGSESLENPTKTMRLSHTMLETDETHFDNEVGSFGFTDVVDEYDNSAAIRALEVCNLSCA